VGRLLQDEEVQKQIRTASVRLRQAWARASGRPPSKAVGDKKLYEQVRGAAVSVATALRLMRKKPEPPKRTGRKVVAGVAVAGGTAYAVKKARGAGGGDRMPQFESNNAAPTGPVAAPTPPTPVAAD
jgi:hypothetical protein